MGAAQIQRRFILCRKRPNETSGRKKKGGKRKKRGICMGKGRKGSEAKQRVEAELVEEVFVHVQVLRGPHCRHCFNQAFSNIC